MEVRNGINAWYVMVNDSRMAAIIYKVEDPDGTFARKVAAVDLLLEACKAALPLIEADIQIAFMQTFETDGRPENARDKLRAAISKAEAKP